MKNLFVKALIVLASFSLAACTTNTQRQNTAVGAVTGAVVGGLAGSAIGAGTGTAVAIGVGAVAGALLGGAIGANMDSIDKQHVYVAMNKPTYKTTKWRNHNTGARYRVKPTSPMMSYRGRANCRKYYSTATYHGKTTRVHGVACQQANGTWVAVS